MAVLAFGGVFLLGNTLGGGPSSGQTTTVVIARQAIPIRHQITDSDLDTERVSGNFTASNNTYSNKSDVVNLISEIQITKGSVITSDMLAKDLGLVPAGSAPAYLPLASGYVAMTIPTGEQQGVAGHISVGDYITVVSSANISIFSTGLASGPPKVVTKTIFTNIHIIGLGPASAGVQSAGAAGTSGSSATTSGITSSLTIELTQCDAEYFIWFLNNTTLRYTLESYHDYLQAPTEPDPTCPTVVTAHGVSQTQVDARYHFTSL
jgi:Flp pilus assembly protein CpaB